MVRNIFYFVRFAPLALFLMIAIVGLFAVLIGSLAGSVEVTEFGKLAAGGGALGFFAWLFLPVLVRAV
ncbi:GlyGly-CTERM sorting domain-containing protein [Bradyrhizobium sp. AUGA SZCCT0222]|uniref:GlyGly-CTERM sorting domain-containing protein n=1 Tax=Bradyrhizobium sp. AUGA SZCCT0222 TaxID=2807668 RepID=UPI001BADBC96|nr:GlyGly-CTERM sorting domain-containing protein [Bradyrhizobium sp. AUGA SZCCT0222]MBR1269777.1 GlyGly-CTERM sorting domain-containing protein [Bradyrhizobium sp. AUGA SZCCT0222]